MQWGERDCGEKKETKQGENRVKINEHGEILGRRRSDSVYKPAGRAAWGPAGDRSPPLQDGREQ